MAHAAVRTVIVPGWRGSGEGHWQHLWAHRLDNAEVVIQDDWEFPHKEAWVSRIAESVLADTLPVVVVAHSLGCIAVAHLPAEVQARIHGALLVAPADPERRGLFADFAPVPYAPLPFHSIVVASTNDPYCPVRTVGAYARAWGSDWVRLPNAGHINAEAGFGAWPLGWALLQSLREGAQAVAMEAGIHARP